MSQAELIAGLNEALNRELSTIIRYMLQGSMIKGRQNQSLRAMYREEVTDEIGHAQYLADKIVMLGGTPKVSPDLTPPPDDVAGNEIPCGDLLPLSVAEHPGLKCELLFEHGDGVSRLVLLPETDDRVDDQEGKYDTEVLPSPDDSGYDDSRLDHPGDRAPEVAEKLQDRALLLLGDLVWTKFLDTIPRLQPGKATLLRREGLVEVINSHLPGLIGADRLLVHRYSRPPPITGIVYRCRCRKAGVGRFIWNRR